MSFARTSILTRSITSVVLVFVLLTSVPFAAFAQGTSASSTSTSLAAQPVKDNCSLFSPANFFYDCIWVPLMNWVGALFLTLGGFVLQVVGSVFDMLIDKVVVAYRQTLETLGIMDAINIGWTVFRDLSNILIIGMFVFIAINIILGLSEFGDKKLIARVLIVAVLINFSLLFTKLIIDTSNFTAYQIYKQTSGGQTNSGGFSIAAGFLQPMGITSVWDTYKVVQANAQGAASKAFFFGFTGGILLLLVAATLLYGVVLIAARAVLFIFLMLTAPIAFATYLVPSFEKSQFGWGNWWKTLINNAVFGPLLMVFLYISLLIITRAGAARSQTIGSFLADPAQAVQNDGGTVILVYIIGIGLLFVSLRLSSQIASSVSGINPITSSFLKGALALTGVGGLAAGALGRATIGRAAAGRLPGVEQRIKEQQVRIAGTAPDSIARRMEQAKLFGLKKQQGVLESTTKRDFNFMNSDAAKNLAKAAGMSGVIAGQKQVGGYAGPRKAAADEAAKQGATVAITKADARDMASKEVEKDQKDDREQLTAQRDASKKLVDAAERMAEAAQKGERLQEQHSQQQQIIQEAARAKEAIDSDFSKGALSAAERQERIQQQDERIKSAHATAKTIQERMSAIEKEHTSAPEYAASKAEMGRLTAELKRLDQEREAQTKQRTQQILDANVDTVQKYAEESLHGYHDDFTVSAARSLAKKKVSVKSMMEKRKQDKEYEEEQLRSAGEGEKKA